MEITKNKIFELFDKSYNEGNYILAYQYTKEGNFDDYSKKLLNEIKFKLDDPVNSVKSFIADDTNKLYLLAAVEEAIICLKSGSNLLNNADSYQILNQSILDYYALPKNTIIRIKKILDDIQQSFETISKILSVKSKIGFGKNFINDLLPELIKNNNISREKKDIAIYNRLQTINKYSFGREKIIIKYLFNSQYLNQEQISKFRYYALTLIILEKLELDMSETEQEKILTDLIKNSHLNQHQKNVSQYCLIKLNPNLITNNDEIADIYKYICYGNFFINFMNNFPDAAFIDSNNAAIALVKMKLSNLTNIISDEDCISILNKFKNFSNNITEITELLEKFYLQNRSKQCGKLTIANNTKQCLFYKIKLSHNEIVEFELQPNERKYYENLRNNDILYVGITIIQNNKELFKFASIDANSYVSCYGTNEVKFAVYFEPDASKEKMEPTEQMILQVANVLKNEYQNQKNRYPTLNVKSFIQGLGCDEIGIENNQTNFTRTLNGLMRPKQLEKAISEILGDYK